MRPVRACCYLLRKSATIHTFGASARRTLRTSSWLEDKNSIRVGCASGFWGDTSVAAPQLVHDGNIDYLVFDYLSEITMSLLARAKKKNREFGGFASDFVDVVGPLLPTMKKQGIRCISNAGGMNPLACANALRAACEKSGVQMNIAVVTGDDLLLSHSETNLEVPPNVQSVNAYMGAGPIARCLDLGAEIVITGRCVDR